MVASLAFLPRDLGNLVVRKLLEEDGAEKTGGFRAVLALRATSRHWRDLVTAHDEAWRLCAGPLARAGQHGQVDKVDRLVSGVFPRNFVFPVLLGAAFPPREVLDLVRPRLAQETLPRAIFATRHASRTVSRLLKRSARAGIVPLVEQLLAEPRETSVMSSALVAAVRGGQAAVVRLLLAQETTEVGASVLCTALDSGNAEIALMCLDALGEAVPRAVALALTSPSTSMDIARVLLAHPAMDEALIGDVLFDAIFLDRLDLIMAILAAQRLDDGVLHEEFLPIVDVSGSREATAVLCEYLGVDLEDETSQ